MEQEKWRWKMGIKVTQASRAEIFDLYNMGCAVMDIVNQTGYGFKYVDNLVWKWEVIKARKKMRDANVEYSKKELIPSYLVNRPNEANFVLLTHNKEVLNAYNKLINP